MSHSCNFSLKALNDSFSFKIESPNKQDIDHFFYSFLMIFPNVLDYEKKNIHCLTSNSEVLKTNLRDFVQLHQHKVPSLNAIEAFIRKLEDNESFFVLPGFIPDQTQSIRLYNYLESEKNETNFHDLNDEVETLFGDFIRSYEITVYGDARLIIGEKIKENKICRFCRKKYPEVTFDKKAHAISEALGNKTLVLSEECDTCNWNFSQTIEPHLVDFLSFDRAFYGIKGKGGFKEFKGKNFKLFKNETLELHYSENDKNKVNFPEVIKLESGRKIINQNIYKTLVKFLLSVIDNDHMEYFSDTLAWINGTIEIPKLPKIAQFTFFKKLVTQPILTVYLRTDDQQYPYAVGEFHFACIKYVFIVPGCSKDSLTFISQEEFSIFWKKFKHFELHDDYATFMNLSDNVERNFNLMLKIKKSEGGINADSI